MQLELTIRFCVFSAWQPVTNPVQGKGLIFQEFCQSFKSQMELLDIAHFKAVCDAS